MARASDPRSAEEGRLAAIRDENERMRLRRRPASREMTNTATIFVVVTIAGAVFISLMISSLISVLSGSEQAGSTLVAGSSATVVLCAAASWLAHRLFGHGPLRRPLAVAFAEWAPSAGCASAATATRGATPG